MRKSIYLIFVLVIMFSFNNIFAQGKRIRYSTAAGEIAVVKEDSLHMIPDSVLISGISVPVDSLVRFFDLEDSLSKYWDSITVALAITDSSVASTVIIIGYLVDSMDVLRSEMPDSAIVVMNDSMPVLRDNMIDSALVVLNDSIPIIRNNMIDSALVVLNDTMPILRNNMIDSAIVITSDSLEGYWDSVQVASAISDSSVAAAAILIADQVDSMNVLRAEMPDSAIVAINDSIPILRNNMIDSALIVLNDSIPILRNNMIDSAIVIVTDSLEGYWDSVLTASAISDSIQTIGGVSVSTIQDSMDVLRAEMPDSAIVVMNDSMPILRNNMIDSALVVLNDTMPVLRNNMIDSALVVMNDSMPILRNNMIDSTLIVLNDSIPILRNNMMDTAIVALTDSLAGYWDSVQVAAAIGDSVAAAVGVTPSVVSDSINANRSFVSRDSVMMIDTTNVGFFTNYYDSDYVFGAPSLDYSNSVNHASRFMFDKGLSAFRAGYTAAEWWDRDSLGSYSFASGRRTKARGSYSFAHGYLSEATHNYTVAMGQSARAYATNSMSFGTKLTVTGNYSIGFSIDNTTRILTQANTFVIMGGNVGIDTLLPDKALHVKGGIKADSLTLNSSLVVNGDSAIFNNDVLTRFQNQVRITSIVGSNELIVEASALPEINLVDGGGTSTTRFAQLLGVNYWNTDNDTTGKFYLSAGSHLINDSVFVVYANGTAVAKILRADSILSIQGTNILDIISDSLGASAITESQLLDSMNVLRDNMIDSALVVLNDSIPVLRNNMIDSALIVMNDTMPVLRNNMIDSALVVLNDSIPIIRNNMIDSAASVYSDSISYAKIDSMNLLGESVPYDIINAQEFVAMDATSDMTATDTVEVIASLDSVGFGDDKWFSTLTARIPDDSASSWQTVKIYSPIIKVPYGFIGIDSVTYKYKTLISETVADTNAVTFAFLRYNSDGTLTAGSSNAQQNSADVWAQSSVTPGGATITRYDRIILNVIFQTIGHAWYAKVTDIRIYWKVGS